jgi:hypothetical protein
MTFSILLIIILSSTSLAKRMPFPSRLYSQHTQVCISPCPYICIYTIQSGRGACRGFVVFMAHMYRKIQDESPYGNFSYTS